MALQNCNAASLIEGNSENTAEGVISTTTPVETPPDELTTLNASEEVNDPSASSSSTEKPQETPTQEPSQQESPKPEQTTNN